MKTIHKYALTNKVNRITMPAGAIVRHVAEQPNTAVVGCLWVEVDTTQPPVTRIFSIYGTGHDMPDDPGVYIGTMLTVGGQFVWHVYEEII